MEASGAIIFKYKGIYIVMFNQFDSYPNYTGLGYDLCQQIANMLAKYGNDKWLEWKKRMKYILILYNKGEKYIINYHLTINNPSTYRLIFHLMLLILSMIMQKSSVLTTI